MKKYTFKEIKEFVSKPLFDENIIINKDPNYPKISIVTPSYNQAEFLERTILSVLNQNYPNLEYIIIDGGSTDGSVEIIKRYEKYLAYWVSEKDKGQSYAVNKGIDKISNGLIGWQNSDDIYLPGIFFHLAKLSQKYPKIEVFYGNIVRIDKYDRIFKRQFCIRPNLFIYKNAGATMCNQSAFFKRSTIAEIGKLDEHLHYVMDYDFFLRMILKKVSMKHNRELCGAIRHHSQSKGGNPNKQRWNKDEFKYIYNKYNMNRNRVFYKYIIARILRLLFSIYSNKLDVLREAVERLKVHYKK